MTETLVPNEQEGRILDALLEGVHPVLEVLRTQREKLRVQRRTLSASGFDTLFEEPKDCPQLRAPSQFTLSDVMGRLSGSACRFSVGIEGGVLRFLRGRVIETSAELPREWTVEDLGYETSGEHPPQNGRDLEALIRLWSSG